MGRQELYEDIPFVAVSGLQKKEHSLSVAFSSFASAIDVLEQEKHLASTGKGMKPEEKEKRLSQMSLLLLDELEADAITVTTPLIFAVLIASLLMFNAGYNISVMNAPEPYVFPGHSTLSWSIANGSAFCVGGPVGASLAGKWADDRGRRGALLLATWLFIIGGIMQSLAPSMLVVTVTRVIIGLASAASTVLVPIYLGEFAQQQIGLEISLFADPESR